MARYKSKTITEDNNTQNEDIIQEVLNDKSVKSSNEDNVENEDIIQEVLNNKSVKSSNEDNVENEDIIQEVLNNKSNNDKKEATKEEPQLKLFNLATKLNNIHCRGSFVLKSALVSFACVEALNEEEAVYKYISSVAMRNNQSFDMAKNKILEGIGKNIIVYQDDINSTIVKL